MIVCTGRKSPLGGVYMTKKLLLVVAIVLIVTTGAFAQLTFGVSAIQYYQEDAEGNLPTLSEAFDDFREGVGVYWGGFGEIILGKLGLGLSFNQQTFEDEFDPTYDMWNYDVNLSLSYHIFGGRAFLDPFLQAGAGILAYDYKNKEEVQILYPDLTDDPLAGSMYYDFGLGLGLNLGGLGIFFKGMWNIQSDEPLYSQDGTVPIFEMPVLPFKWVFGAKLIL
jgi:hypothetical protein